MNTSSAELKLTSLFLVKTILVIKYKMYAVNLEMNNGVHEWNRNREKTKLVLNYARVDPEMNTLLAKPK